MESLLKDVEPRLQKVLLQLKYEITIFERLMYKNANQHRRALYFRRLCQVQRDLRLLQSAHLPDLIQNTTQYFRNTSKESSLQKGRWQSKNTSSEAQNLKRRLYGVAKLMEQMSDPILHASSQVAGLLGQTFFMPFSLTTYSILARLRVLVLQGLHDIVEVFNVFSAWASQKGLFDHNVCDSPGSLKCKWDGTKLSLLATFTHQQLDIPVENEGFVEDRNGRKYSVLGSLVSGDVLADTNGADEVTLSANLTSKANVENESGANLVTPSNEEIDIRRSMEKPDGLENLWTPSNEEINIHRSMEQPDCLIQDEDKAKEHLVTCTDSIHVPQTKKVAYVSVHSTCASEREKGKEEMHPPKKAKKDTLFDMLLGLEDSTHKNVF